jgi:cytosine/adenosine deaminase-related metal-dependent hydrolase
VRPLRLRGRWVLPVAEPPLPDAAVLIGEDGRIAAVGPDALVPAPPGTLELDFPRGIVLPGLINTHTHLELTGLEAHAPAENQAIEPSFRDWIQTIRRTKEARSHEAFLEAARLGVRSCWEAGVTTVADTGDSGAVIQALAELDGSGTVYHEVFGPHPDQLDASSESLRRRAAELAGFASGRIRLGVSPHAPYTVSGPLYARVAGWARSEGLPIAVHVAESREESELVTRQAGPFAEAWRTRGIPPIESPLPLSPMEWLDRHGVLGPDTLCIHAIQLSESDIALLAERGAAVAHCPLSNARHRHGGAPLARLRRAGIPVGLGTDSVASVGRLDLLAEARAARELGGLSAADALALATREGARALGLEQETGTLTAGKWGDVVVLGEAEPSAEPEEAVLSSPTTAVLLTVLGGRVVHRIGSPA